MQGVGRSQLRRIGSEDVYYIPVWVPGHMILAIDGLVEDFNSGKPFRISILVIGIVGQQ